MLCSGPTLLHKTSSLSGAVNKSHLIDIRLLDKNINPDSLDLQLLETALSTGSVENSMKWLENYVKSQEQAHLSFLMQQYAFSEFTGKISRLSRINNITLSNQNISLLISAKNISGFYEAFPVM